MGPSMDKAFLKALNDAVLERPYSKVFFDAPTLYESGREYMVDKVWVVAAGLETRIRRIMDRDGLSREQVLARMANPLPEE